MDLSRAIFLDTETTTNKATPERPLEVIELAWAAVPHFGAPPAKAETIRFKPTIPATWGALAVHHILPEELLDKHPASEAPRYVPGAATPFWIGHNIDFDWKALGSPAGTKRICTLALARWAWPQLDSHTLSACMYFVFGANRQTRERLRSAHSAQADIEMVHDLLWQMLQVVPAMKGLDTLEKLYAASEEARIPKVFTFGKFSGQPIRAADRGYAQWYRKQADPDPYYLEAFRREGLL